MKRNEWIQGYACALAVYLKLVGVNDTYADEMWREIGSVENARKAGVDENDIEEFKKYWK